MRQIISTERNTYNIRDIKPIKRDISGIDFSTLREYQVEIAKDLLTHDCGTVQLYVGFGKTYLIAWLCNHLPRPILITEPSFALCEEVVIRLKAMGVDMEGITVLNPMAYYALHEKDDSWIPEIKTWLSDETSITMSMEYILERCRPEVMFAFTYTPDKRNNAQLTDVKNYAVSDNVCKLMQWFGPTLVYARLKKHIELVTEKVHLGQCAYKLENYSDWKYKKAIDKCFKSEELIDYLSKCLDMCGSPMLLPFTDHKQVERILEHPKMKKYHVCLWDANTLRLNNGKTFDKKHPWKPGMSNYEVVKLMVDKNNVQLIMCSSIAFKGVDLPKASNIMMLVGGNAGNIIQMVGRVCRSTNPRVFLPENADFNPLFEASFKKRKKWIEDMNKTFEEEDQLLLDEISK